MTQRYSTPHKRKRIKTHSCDERLHDCSRCGETKACNEYPSDFPRGRWCYACRAEVQRQRRAGMSPDEREAYRVDMRQRYDPRRARAYTLRKSYGLSLEEYESAAEAQGGRCLICREHPEDGILRVDHHHGTGVVRGLLCDRCNRALGLLRDDPEVLEAAAAYLRGALKFRGGAGTVTTIAVT